MNLKNRIEKLEEVEHKHRPRYSSEELAARKAWAKKKVKKAYAARGMKDPSYSSEEQALYERLYAQEHQGSPDHAVRFDAARKAHEVVLRARIQK